jgi:hypothetical protein
MGFSTTGFATAAHFAAMLLARSFALALGLFIFFQPSSAGATNIKSIMGGAKDTADCKLKLTAQVYSPSQYLGEQWDTEWTDPCPNYDQSSSAEVKCKDLVAKLEREMNQWLAAHKAHCDLLTNTPKCDGGGASQTKCLEDHLRTLQAASESVEREKREVERVTTEFEAAQKKMADSVANLPPKNSPPRRWEQTTKSTASQLAQFAQKIAQGKVTGSDISRTTDPMVHEPLVVAEMLQEVRQQLNRRENKLKSTSSELGRKSAIDSANIADNSSLTEGSGGGAGGSGSNGAGDLAKAAFGGLGSLAQAGGAGGGAGSGSGGSGGGSPYSSGGLGAEDSAKGNSPRGSTSVGFNNTSKSGRATNQSGEAIDFTEKAVALQSGAEAGEYGASGASSSQSLKDSLRAKLKNGGNSAPNGGSLGASAAADGVAGAGNANKSEGTAGDTFAPLAGLKSEDVFAGLGGGGSPLGGGESFDLAGSETDAFVKSMVGSLSAELGDDEGDRSLASLESREEGVLEENTESLFLRTKSTLVRSVKRGNLVTNLRSKL